MLSKLTEKTFSYEYFGEYFSNLEKSFENSNENNIFKIAKVWIPTLGTTSISIFIAINKSDFKENLIENLIYLLIILFLFIILYTSVFNEKLKKWYGLNMASSANTKFSNNWYKKVRNEQFFVYNFLKLENTIDKLDELEKEIIDQEVKNYVLDAIRTILIMEQDIKNNDKIYLLIKILDKNLKNLKEKHIITVKEYNSYNNDLNKIQEYHNKTLDDE